MLERLRAWVPRWWRGEEGAAGRALAAALLPAELLYRGVVRGRNAAYDRGWLPSTRASLPVISIGNIGVGGAGKTPFAAWVAGRLAGWGQRPAVILRGYGADEVLVHRELNPGVPVLAARRRHEAVARAAERGCTVAVLDDAFQHRALGRDLDIVLVSAESWRSPRRLLPRGPWRESPAALRRADLVVVTRKTAPLTEARGIAAALGAGPIVLCRLAPTGLCALAGGDLTGAAALRGREVLAAASLADPEPFAEHLRAAGARVELAAYPDHHPFDPEDAAVLQARARGRPIVMTRKEAVKLRPLLPADAEAYVLEQRVEIEDGEAALERALRAAVER